MDNPAIVAAWAAAFAAIIGPILGVAMAHKYSRSESKRVAAASLFRNIVEHCYRYKIGFQKYKHCRRAIVHTAQAMKTIEFNPNFHGPGDYQAASEKNAIALLEVHEAELALRSVESLLRADILSLKLLFDGKASQCESAIFRLTDTLDSLRRKELVDPENAAKHVEKTTREVEDCLVPLHDSLRKSDPLED